MFLNIFMGRKRANLVIEILLLCIMLLYSVVTIANGTFSSFILFVFLTVVFLNRIVEKYMWKTNLMMFAICFIASIALYFKLPN
ncbi:hypothetical protein T458_25355 [Brevibacillus panacihumi W25]|uniref:Uncharacterized protein n=1 Tax=Brevibacillus panacihumi W25 TaxID=1408254 RepID=V6M0I8_9BACL|nr:hypothetical protein T458_25355 [Brevibacillus panacihumi W25]